MLNRLTREFFQAFYSPKFLYQEISRGQESSSWLCVLIYCLIYCWDHFGCTFKVLPHL